MEKVTVPLTKEGALAALRQENPIARAALLVIYADAFLDYVMAQQNIEANGTIVFHPRTGAPIDNPYANIRARAAKELSRSSLKADSLWALSPWPSVGPAKRGKS